MASSALYLDVSTAFRFLGAGGYQGALYHAPGFERWLDTSEGRGVTYSVFNGSRNVTAEELHLNGVHEVIRIAPVIIGSKKAGVFQTIFGAVLVAVGFALSFTPAAVASPFLYKMGRR